MDDQVLPSDPTFISNMQGMGTHSLLFDPNQSEASKEASQMLESQQNLNFNRGNNLDLISENYNETEMTVH